MRLIAPLLAALLIATAAAGGSTTAGVSGVVKDGSGNPVAGAEVTLTMADLGTKLTLKSDAKGKFVQVGIKSGEYEVVARKSGWADARTTVQLKLGPPTPVEVVLGSAPAAASAPSAGLSLGGLKVSKEADVAYRKAQAAVAAGDSAAARAALETLIGLEPTLSAPYFVLAQNYRDSGDDKKASELLVQGLERKPDESAAWVALGEIQSDLGEGDAAVRSFRKASEIAPTDPAPYRKLGMALVLQQEFAGAAAALESYLKLAPDAPDAAEKRVLIDELAKTAARK